VQIGTAFVDRGRCLPWAMEIPCIVCEEMCPTSPKAVWLEPVEIVRRDGTRVALQRPYVDPEMCNGCGLCENRCPVGEQAAIRVSAIGETRDPRNRMLQQRST
jgi:ferredoxin